MFLYPCGCEISERFSSLRCGQYPALDLMATSYKLARSKTDACTKQEATNVREDEFELSCALSTFRASYFSTIVRTTLVHERALAPVRKSL